MPANPKRQMAGAFQDLSACPIILAGVRLPYDPDQGVFAFTDLIILCQNRHRNEKLATKNNE